MIWALKRIGVSIVLVWIVASIVFLAIRLVPGDPAELLLSQGGVAPDPASVEQLRKQLGLELPLGRAIRRQHGHAAARESGGQPAGRQPGRG